MNRHDTQRESQSNFVQTNKESQSLHNKWSVLSIAFAGQCCSEHKEFIKKFVSHIELNLSSHSNSTNNGKLKGLTEIAENRLTEITNFIEYHRRVYGSYDKDKIEGFEEVAVELQRALDRSRGVDAASPYSPTLLAKEKARKDVARRFDPSKAKEGITADVQSDAGSPQELHRKLGVLFGHTVSEPHVEKSVVIEEPEEPREATPEDADEKEEHLDATARSSSVKSAAKEQQASAPNNKRRSSAAPNIGANTISLERMKLAEGLGQGIKRDSRATAKTIGKERSSSRQRSMSPEATNKRGFGFTVRASASKSSRPAAAETPNDKAATTPKGKKKTTPRVRANSALKDKSPEINCGASQDSKSATVRSGSTASVTRKLGLPLGTLRSGSTSSKTGEGVQHDSIFDAPSPHAATQFPTPLNTARRVEVENVRKSEQLEVVLEEQDNRLEAAQQAATDALALANDQLYETQRVTAEKDKEASCRLAAEVEVSKLKEELRMEQSKVQSITQEQSELKSELKEHSNHVGIVALLGFIFGVLFYAFLFPSVLQVYHDMFLMTPNTVAARADPPLAAGGEAHRGSFSRGGEPGHTIHEVTGAGAEAAGENN